MEHKSAYGGSSCIPLPMHDQDPNKKSSALFELFHHQTHPKHPKEKGLGLDVFGCIVCDHMTNHVSQAGIPFSSEKRFAKQKFSINVTQGNVFTLCPNILERFIVISTLCLCLSCCLLLV